VLDLNVSIFRHVPSLNDGVMRHSACNVATDQESQYCSIAVMATDKVNSAVTPNQMVCVDDFERYAEKTVASATLGYFQGGADAEVTLKDNVIAFTR